jgi:hypothetical protein
VGVEGRASRRPSRGTVLTDPRHVARPTHGFLAGEEIVFLFEGPDADEEVRRLMRDRHVLGQASRIAVQLSGGPRFPEEVFSWSRPELVEGLRFSGLPGPGNSEGGPAE